MMKWVFSHSYIASITSHAETKLEEMPWRKYCLTVCEALLLLLSMTQGFSTCQLLQSSVVVRGNNV